MVRVTCPILNTICCSNANSCSECHVYLINQSWRKHCPKCNRFMTWEYFNKVYLCKKCGIILPETKKENLNKLLKQFNGMKITKKNSERIYNLNNKGIFKGAKKNEQ